MNAIPNFDCYGYEPDCPEDPFEQEPDRSHDGGCSTSEGSVVGAMAVLWMLIPRRRLR